MGMKDDLFEQITNITKAHGYDILSEQVKELKEANKDLIDVGSRILAVMALEKVERYDLVEALKTAILNAQKIH